jgi:hypothetical protein
MTTAQLTQAKVVAAALQKVFARQITVSPTKKLMEVNLQKKNLVTIPSGRD